MLVERVILEDKLKDVIKEYGGERQVSEQVIREMNDRNILDGDVNSILQGTTPISSVDDFILYSVTKALFHATKSQKINPVDYFTKVEIEDGDKWKQEEPIELKKQSSTKFHPVIKIDTNTWLTSKTIQELFDMFNARTLVYNVKTQRPLRISENRGKIVQRIDINPKAVDAMEKLMSKGLYFPDPLTINALNDESLEMIENEKNMSISFESGELDLTDGWHRLRAYFKVLVKNPTFGEIVVPIVLTRHTESRARDYISQKSEHNPISDEYKKIINPSKLSNQIVEYLNTEPTSLLKGRISKDSASLRIFKGESLVLFNTLSDVIDLTFSPKTQTEVVKLSKYITKGLNHIMSIYDHLSTEVQNDVVWCTYICLLFLIKDNKKWMNTLDDVILNINPSQITFKAVNKVGIKNVIETLKPLLSQTEGNGE